MPQLSSLCILSGVNIYLRKGYKLLLCFPAEISVVQSLWSSCLIKIQFENIIQGHSHIFVYVEF